MATAPKKSRAAKDIRDGAASARFDRRTGELSPVGSFNREAVASWPDER